MSLYRSSSCLKRSSERSAPTRRCLTWCRRCRARPAGATAALAGPLSNRARSCVRSRRTRTARSRPSPEPDGPLTDRLGENDLQRTLTHAPAAPWWRQRTWHSHGRATHDCPTRTTYTKNPIRGQEDRRDLTDCLPGLLFGIQCYVLVILFDQKVVELTLNRNNYTLRITRIYHQSITTITPITNDGSLVL